MNNDFLYIGLCIVILLIVIGVIFFWVRENSKPYTINDTIKGFYTNAQLNQRCVSSTQQTAITLLPGFFEPQTCGYNLECVKGNTGDLYGICKASLGGYCGNVYDCAASTTGQTIYCQPSKTGGVCGLTGGGALGAPCGAGITGGVNIPCNSAAGLYCYNNQICLKSDGQICSKSSQCGGGLCDTNQTPSVCISPIGPAQVCDVNYCQTGFACDLSSSTTGYCQPIIGNTGAITGEIGSFCNIPYQGTTLTCNSGLVCNFDAYLSAPTNYPGLTGYGLCDIPKLPITSICNSLGGACIPPNVCYNGICTAPNDPSGNSDINYCGPTGPSTGICGLGYSCDLNSYMCLPSTGYTCNSQNGFTGSTGNCQSGTCSSYKIGAFNPIRNKTGSTGNFGTWVYIDLPSLETIIPSNQSTLSTFQYMTLDVSNVPEVRTKCIYTPEIQNFTSGSTYFWYSEFKIDILDTVVFTQPWTKILTSSVLGLITPVIIDGFKFTTGGNITLKYQDIFLSNCSIVRNINISNLNIIGGTLDLDTASTAAIFNSSSPIYVQSWDVDDMYNVSSSGPSIVGLYNDTTSTSTFYYGSLSIAYPALNNINTSYTYTNDSPSTISTWVKYMYVPLFSPGNSNFIFSGTPPSSNTYNIIIPSVLTTNSDVEIPLLEPTCSGSASFFTYTNNLYNYELYYVSDKGYRYFNSTLKQNSTDIYIDVPIEGYSPDFVQSTTPPTPINFINTTTAMSYGNLDTKMYSIITVCS